MMFGLGCSLAGEKSKPIIQLATGIREVSTLCLEGVMLLAPLGIFSNLLINLWQLEPNQTTFLDGSISRLIHARSKSKPRLALLLKSGSIENPLNMNGVGSHH